MTAATLAHLPLQVGGAALASTGRAALWVIALYMRSPLTNTAIAALVIASALAGSNALYGQRHAHPAPLFSPVIESDAPREIEPVIPKTRPKSFVVGTPVKLQRSLSEVAAPISPIGNKEVFELQRRLERLQLFSGTIDGYYGPQTARAIRKFEELRGLKPTGELTTATMDLILTTPLSTPEAQPVAVAMRAPVVEEAPAAIVTLPKVQSAAIEEDLPAAGKIKPQQLAALAQPKPLTEEIETGSILPAKKAASPKLLGRPVPETAEAALEMAADTAGDAINTIIDGVQSMAMSAPPKRLDAQQFAAQAKALTTAAAVAPIALVPKSAERTQLAALPDNPQVGVPLQIEEEAPKPGEAIAVLDTEATPDEIMAPFSVTDPVIVAKVQRGLGSLGFLHGPADGVAGEATAKAIRNFEVYFNYKVTGRISPELLDLLVDNGASI